MQTLAPERQRHRRLHRQPDGGAQGAGRGRVATLLPDRQRREDPGRVQPGRGRRIPADRLRERALLKREDFNNDQVDAGEIGAGHAVTALYEITPGQARRALDRPAALRRAGRADRGRLAAASTRSCACATSCRAKADEPADRAPGDAVRQATPSIERAPAEARFAVAVAAFGELLRGDPYLKHYGYDDVARPRPAARAAATLRLPRRVRAARAPGRQRPGAGRAAIGRPARSADGRSWRRLRRQRDRPLVRLMRRRRLRAAAPRPRARAWSPARKSAQRLRERDHFPVIEIDAA